MATQTERTVVYAAGMVQGIAAFRVGPLVDSGVELSTVYALAAIVAAAMGLVSFVVVRRGPGQSVRARAAS